MDFQTLKTLSGFRFEGVVSLDPVHQLPVLSIRESKSSLCRIYFYTVSSGAEPEVIYVGSTRKDVKSRARSHWGRMVKIKHSPKEYVPAYRDLWLPKLREVSEMTLWSIDPPMVSVFGEEIPALLDGERALIEGLKPCLNQI